ncbi:hypothetical protein H8356DRAFT_1290009 [Neocallimastix lanati (nom. inval.)]|nr:hypothetical protein H8356DRAFT_1290009 [Neocallimastix sp. JGI-2020a]
MINTITTKAKGCTDSSIVGLYVALIEKIKNELSMSFPFATSYSNNAMNTDADIDLTNNTDKLGAMSFSSQQIEGLLYRYNYASGITLNFIQQISSSPEKLKDITYIVMPHHGMDPLYDFIL